MKTSDKTTGNLVSVSFKSSFEQQRAPVVYLVFFDSFKRSAGKYKSHPESTHFVVQHICLTQCADIIY